MALRLVYGRAGSGKSYFCLNDIKDRIDKGATNPLILLVPEQFSLQAEKNLVDTVSTGGIIKTEVLSFRRIAHRAFNEVGGIARTRINSAGKCMVIHRILENLKNQLGVFSKSADQLGLVNAISDLIAELKRYDITPEDLKNIYGFRNPISNKENRLLMDKIEEISLIYGEYEKFISDEYRDTDDDLTMLYKKLDETTIFNDSEIWIDEFTGFTTQEYKVIYKLMKKARRINVCLCTDYFMDVGFYKDYDHIDHTDIFSPVKDTGVKLIRMAKELDLPVEYRAITKVKNLDKKSKNINPRFKNSRELQHLEKHFFSFPYKQYRKDKNKGDALDKTEDISIFISTNIYTEIEHTAEDIIRLCRDEGLRYRDITVVCGNLDVYEKFVRAIFAEYKIPFFIDKKRDISNHPLIQLILSVLEIFIYNWSYESVFRYLKTGLTGIPRKDIDLIENYVLACGIRGNRWITEKDWTYIPELTWDPEKKQEYNDLLIKVNKIRRNVIYPLKKFYSEISKEKTTREICGALFNLLCTLEVPQSINHFIDKFEEGGELSRASEYGQMWNIVIEVLDQTVELLEHEKMNLKRLQDVLKIGFAEHKISLIPPALDQVLVGNIERSKSHEVKALYILGVNDGVFPSPDTGEGIFSDKDRDVLRSLGIELAKDTRTKAFEEQHMIYSALTTPEKYLKLSVPIADHGGKTLRPSIIISRIRKIFPGILETNNIICPDGERAELELVSAAKPTFNRLLTMIRRKMENHEIHPLWKDVYLWYAGRKEWRDKCDLMPLAVSYSNLVSPLGKDRALGLYGNPLYSSVSRFEKYASCPFAYFLQYGLKVEERRIFSLTLPDIGVFLHAVMEEFSRYILKNNIKWGSIEKVWCKEKVTEISDNLLKSMQGGPIKHGTNRYKILIKRLDRVLFRSIWAVIEHIKRSSFEPIGHEIYFGSKGRFPPININYSTGETIKLTGRIDRVDAFRSGDKTYVRVIDYKSGSKDFSLNNVYYGKQLQLITYLDAIWKDTNVVRNEKTKVMPGGILYFRIDDPIIRGNKDLTEEEVEKTIMKRLKMNGLLLSDVNIIKEMDKTIDGDSTIIPVRINKDGTLGKASSVATVEQFQTLRKYIRQLLESLGTKMLKGDISIAPYKDEKTTSCRYCNYTSICQFDTILEGNKYRILTNKSDSEIWELIE